MCRPRRRFAQNAHWAASSARRHLRIRHGRQFGGAHFGGLEAGRAGIDARFQSRRGAEAGGLDGPTVVWSEDADAVLNSDADVIVELVGGLDPAGAWVRRALEAGKSVVTANKKLIAFHGVELERLAAAQGGHLKYGAAVAGGIPVIPGLEQGLAGDRIERIEGILNGTCNFILSKMDEGAEFATVLATAQAKGYAEADPTEDVGGFDARAKLAILMRLALRVGVNPEEIVPRSITAISAVDFSYAHYLGYTIRQVSRAEKTGGTVAATVGPMLVDQRSPMAWSRGTENMVIVSGHYGGNVVFSGHGAGGQPTAVAVVSDLIALAHRSRRVEIPSTSANVAAEFEVPHYIRFLVNDRPGIVAEITGSLAKERINIRAIVQKPGLSAARASVRGYRGAVQVFGAAAGAGADPHHAVPARAAAGFADAGIENSCQSSVFSFQTKAENRRGCEGFS